VITRRATNGQVYEEHQAIIESAKHDIPCADVTPVQGTGLLVEGCGVRVGYTTTVSDDTTQVVLTSRVLIVNPGTTTAP
jgi:hypothetical protein